MTSSIDNAMMSADRTQRIVEALGEDRQSRSGGLSAFFGWSVKAALVFGLAALSWLATYTGMLELIRANAGTDDLGLGMLLAIGFAVAMLMLMIIYILDQLFTEMTWWLRALFIAGYIFLTLISVGFGFGFYWKFLEARSEATRSAEAAVTTVQGALQMGQSRLEQLASTLTALTVISSKKAVQEREKGNTCPNSRPGDGPRRRLRDADAAAFSVAAEFIGSRVDKVKKDIAELTRDLKLVTSGARTDPKTGRSIVDPKTGTRNGFLRDMSRRMNLTITRFNSLRSDPQLRQYRNAFAERAGKTVFPDGRGGTFRCPDPHLQSALLGAVRAIDSLPVIKNPKVAAVEGSEAIIEAFRRLTTSFMGALTFRLPPSPDELRELQRAAVQKAGKNSKEASAVLEMTPGLGHRDYIPLFVAIFVDFCLLLVSINRPIYRFRALNNLVAQARAETLRGLLLDYYHVSHGEQEKQFEQLQHVIFDFGGDYYAAVPLNSQDKDARYLATLFAALEDKGVVKRGLFLLNAFGLGSYFVRRKLRIQNSRFAYENAYRLYRFYDGAWSELVRNVSLEAAAIEKARQSEIEAKKEAERKRREEELQRQREEQLEREKREREMQHRLELAQVEKGLKELGIGPRFGAPADSATADMKPAAAAESASSATSAPARFSASASIGSMAAAAPEETAAESGSAVADGDGQGDVPANGQVNGTANGQVNGTANGHGPVETLAAAIAPGDGADEVSALPEMFAPQQGETATGEAGRMGLETLADAGQAWSDHSDPGDHRDRVNFDVRGQAAYLRDLQDSEPATERKVEAGLKALAERLSSQRRDMDVSSATAEEALAQKPELDGDSTEDARPDPLLEEVLEKNDLDDDGSIREIARMFSLDRGIAEKFRPARRDDLEPDDLGTDDMADDVSPNTDANGLAAEVAPVYSLAPEEEGEDDLQTDHFDRPTLTLIPRQPKYEDFAALAPVPGSKDRFN